MVLQGIIASGSVSCTAVRHNLVLLSYIQGNVWPGLGLVDHTRMRYGSMMTALPASTVHFAFHVVHLKGLSAVRPRKIRRKGLCHNEPRYWCVASTYVPIFHFDFFMGSSCTTAAQLHNWSAHTAPVHDRDECGRRQMLLSLCYAIRSPDAHRRACPRGSVPGTKVLADEKLTSDWTICVKPLQVLSSRVYLDTFAPSVVLGV